MKTIIPQKLKITEAPKSNTTKNTNTATNTTRTNNTTQMQPSIYSDNQAENNGFSNFDSLSNEEVDSLYEQWRLEKEKLGLRTTHMRNADEVNFAEYGAALSEELKAELMSYFEDGAINREEALKAQQEIAGLYKNDNSLYYADFVKAVRALGYDISAESVETAHIIDDKKSKAKGGGTLDETGHITVYTIKNKDGEVLFKIADSNGNAEIELEEVFMNELLSGISNQIDANNLAAAVGVYTGAGTSDGTYASYLDAYGNEVEGSVADAVNDSETKDGKYVINKAQYDKLLNEKTRLLVQGGLDEFSARAEAKKFMDKNYSVDINSSNKAVRVAGFSNTDPRIRVNKEQYGELEEITTQEVEELLADEEFINNVLSSADYEKYSEEYANSEMAQYFIAHKDEYLQGVSAEELAQAYLRENFTVEEKEEEEVA